MTDFFRCRDRRATPHDHAWFRRHPRPPGARTGLGGDAGGARQPEARAELPLRIHALVQCCRIWTACLQGRSFETFEERGDQICDLGGAREGWAEDYAEMGIRAVLWVMFRSPGTGIRSATIWILRGATACFARRLRQRTKPPAMPAAASSASSPLPRLIPAARAKSGRRRARPRAADPDPCGPVHHRVSGNREAIWRNTDRLAGEDRRARRGYRHRPWHFSQRSPVPALPACGRLFAPARQRRASRPLPGCVCTTRHRDEHA